MNRALYIVLLHRIRIPGITSFQILFYVSINSIVFMGAYGLLNGSFVTAIPGITFTGWLIAALVLVILVVLGEGFFSFGVRKTDAGIAAIASTLEPIVSILIGIFFLHESFSIRTILCSVLVLSAVLLLTWKRRN